MVLILLGMVVLTVFTGMNLSSYVKENLTVTMVLSPDMSDQEAQRLSQLVAQQPYIEKTNFVSKEQALKEWAPRNLRRSVGVCRREPVHC